MTTKNKKARTRKQSTDWMNHDFRQLIQWYISTHDLVIDTQSAQSNPLKMMYKIYVLCLLATAMAAPSPVAEIPVEVELEVKQEAEPELDESRLAGIFVKDGNENGQLRFLASGLTSSSSTTGSTGFNSALNQYITNKQDMLEQLRPSSTGTGTTTGTGTSLVTGTSTSGTGSGLVTTTSNGAIYVNAGGSSSSASSGSSSTNAALNQAIYGASPIADLLPQIVAQGLSTRRRPGNNNIRRRVPNRRRVNKRRGSVNNNNLQRRRRRGNKRGKKKAQVMVVRPNRG
ncbi:period circadian protein [Drosophila persimilis]|uniref:period circadian protein n=1 Tax=Drosophila persimilis TaxID=7234 RepID=UPI000F088C56|nr:period circadian protein [Drosophila persimilis]